MQTETIRAAATNFIDAYAALVRAGEHNEGIAHIAQSFETALLGLRDSLSVDAQQAWLCQGFAAAVEVAALEADPATTPAPRINARPENALAGELPELDGFTLPEHLRNLADLVIRHARAPRAEAAR